MTTIQTTQGQTVDFNVAVNLMDDDIREELHLTLKDTTPQNFYDAYCRAHADKFDGEDFSAA